MEAEPGIEPRSTALQGAAPLYISMGYEICHPYYHILPIYQPRFDALYIVMGTWGELKREANRLEQKTTYSCLLSYPPRSLLFLNLLGWQLTKHLQLRDYRSHLRTARVHVFRHDTNSDAYGVEQ